MQKYRHLRMVVLSRSVTSPARDNVSYEFKNGINLETVDERSVEQMYLMKGKKNFGGTLFPHVV